MSEPTRARPTGRVGVRESRRAAGVSTQTVSRVINDHPGIRAETRQRVLDAMAALDYRVNNAARALGTRRTRTLGVIASDASCTAGGRHRGARGGGARGRAVGRDRLRGRRRRGIRRRGRAAPARAGRRRDRRRRTARAHARRRSPARDLGLPVVALARTGRRPPCSSEAAALAVEHLVDLGHRRIARLAGPQDWLEAVARDDGLRRRARRARPRCPAGCWGGDWTRRVRARSRPVASIARAVRTAGRRRSSSRTTRWRSASSRAARCGRRRARRVSVVGLRRQPGCRVLPSRAHHRAARHRGGGARCVAEVLGVTAPERRSRPCARCARRPRRAALIRARARLPSMHGSRRVHGFAAVPPCVRRDAVHSDVQPVADARCYR